MQFLLHTDYLLQLLEDPKSLGKSWDLFRTRVYHGWVSPLSLPILQSESKSPKIGSYDLDDILSSLNILSVTANDVQESMNGGPSGLEDALAITLAKSYGLNGIVTASPDTVRSDDSISILQPEQLVAQSKENVSEKIKVPLLDIPASYPEILKPVEGGISKVVRSGRFILGSAVESLEKEIAEYCQSEYAVGVSSGTDALIIALMACDIGYGDEVITTPYSFFATAGSISRLGARPVFVDIDPDTYNINPHQIKEKITPNTKAILPVHLYGQCADMDPILEIAKTHNLKVIEDAAQAIGSEYKSRRAGSLGDIGCFSFFPSKNLGAFGDGGIVTTSSVQLYEKIKILRAHGSKPKYFHKWIGGNFRLDALQAAVVSAKLPFLEGWTKKRRSNAGFYTSHLKKLALSLPQEIFPRHIYNQYVVRVPGIRDNLRKYLQEQSIASEIYYPVPLHLQECFADLGFKSGDLPEAERAAQETLALPIFPELSMIQLETLVNAISNFLKD